MADQNASGVKLCMIGAGSHAARNICPYFHLLRGGYVAANADLQRDRAEAAARRFAIPRFYTDYHEMLEAERPDGVIVCVNRDFHARAAVELMDMGCHVYTEKPNASSAEASRQVLEAQRRTGRVCMVAYKKRFAPACRKAREIIRGEAFGEASLLTLLRTAWHNPDNDDPHREHLLDWGCHTIDLATFLFGRLRRVSAFMTPGRTHSYAVNFLFANGAVGQHAFSNRPNAGLEEVFAAGTGGVSVRLRNGIEMQAFRGDQPIAAHRPQFTTGATHAGIEQGFVGELQEFVDAIAEGRRPESDIAEATHTLEVFDAIQQSRHTGQPVEIEDSA